MMYMHFRKQHLRVRSSLFSWKMIVLLVIFFLVLFMLLQYNTEEWKSTRTVQTQLIKHRPRVVVVSIAVYFGMNVDYAFCVPFVVAAWERMDWNVVILVVGDIDFWMRTAALTLVKQTTIKISYDVKFVLVPVQANAVLYSKVASLFATLVIPGVKADDIVLVSDTDILPVNKSVYAQMRSGNVTVLRDAGCCDTFTLGRKTVTYQPFPLISMPSKTWRTVMEIEKVDTKLLPDLINEWLKTKFNGKTISNTEGKFGPDDIFPEDYWRLEERVLSSQMDKIREQKHIVARNTAKDRVDRSRMNSWKDFNSYIDARMFLPAFKGLEWEKTLQLCKAILSENMLARLTSFKSSFVKTMYERYGRWDFL